MTFVKSKLALTPFFFAAALIASPALADCAAEIDKVAVATESAELSAEDRAKVETATMAAQEKAAASDETACMTEIAAAKAVLNIE